MLSLCISLSTVLLAIPSLLSLRILIVCKNQFLFSKFVGVIKNIGILVWVWVKICVQWESLGIFLFYYFICPEHAYTCLIFITSLFPQDFHDLFSYIKNSFSFSVEKNQSHKGSHEKLYMKKFANLKQKSIPVMYSFVRYGISCANEKYALCLYQNEHTICIYIYVHLYKNHWTMK